MSGKFGTPKCIVCQKPVYLSDSATVGGKQVHKSTCLKCATCGKSLSVDMATEHNGQLYCTRDLRLAKGETTGTASVKHFPTVGQASHPQPAHSQAHASPRLAPPSSASASSAPAAGASAGPQVRKRSPSTSLQNNSVRQRAAAAPPVLPGTDGTTVPLSKAVFTKYAQDRKGLTPQEFQVMCMEMGYLLSDEEFTMAIKLLDADHSGSIEYNEFLRFWKTDERFAKLQLSEAKLAELNEMFRLFISFDADGNGTIDQKEFALMHADLTAKGYSRTTTEKEWANIDIDGSGFISFNEFVDWLVAKRQ
eukprot:m51a1_g8480 putative ef hand domain containing protein (307) ;mRNA; r:518859-520266